jgi:hypothetical protein
MRVGAEKLRPSSRAVHKRKKAVFASSGSPVWLAMAESGDIRPHTHAGQPMEVLRR